MRAFAETARANSNRAAISAIASPAITSPNCHFSAYPRGFGIARALLGIAKDHTIADVRLARIRGKFELFLKLNRRQISEFCVFRDLRHRHILKHRDRPNRVVCVVTEGGRQWLGGHFYVEKTRAIGQHRNAQRTDQ